ncbi:MAG TPA: hypothetical protein VGK89_07315 [Candidatus Eisenbacteria bacterium]
MSVPSAARVPAAVVAGVGFGLLVHLGLAAGLLGALPGSLRLALAFAVLVMLPGYAWVLLGALPPGGWWLSPAWAFGLGVAWNAVLVVAAGALGLPVTALAGWGVGASAVLWAAALVRGLRTASAPSPGLGRAALVAIGLALAVASLHVARVGPMISYFSDAPDHIGTVRRILSTGLPFPHDAYFRDAGPAGADPRKGLWHSQVAVLSRLAGLDPLETWSALPVLVAPLVVLDAAALGLLVGGAPGAAVAAWALLLVHGGSTAANVLRQSVYPSRLVDPLALGAVVAVLADLGAPSRARRFTAAGLALGAVTTHVHGAFVLAIGLGSLGLGLLLRDRAWGAEEKRLAGTGALMAALCAPWMLMRALASLAPANAIHAEPQGLLWVGGGLAVVSPGVLWETMGWAWVLFPLSWLPLWRSARANPAALYLLTSSVAVALVAFDPLAVAVLEPRVGYLLMRLVWLLPLPGLVAWAFPALAARLAPRPSARGLAALGIVLIALAPRVRDSLQVMADPRVVTDSERRTSPLAWRDALAWMDGHLPPGRVVLSDPITSYSIPMMTRHYVVAMPDQHGSPNDPRALTRILDTRDALDPYGTWERLREVVARYGVEAIALNDRFAEPPRLDYWAPRHEWFAAARARLDRHPAAFERVLDPGDFVVYAVHRAALDTLSEPAPPRPFVTPFRSGALPIARRMDAGLPALHRLTLWPRAAARGDTVRGVAEWRALERARPASYFVAVRFDQDLPGGFRPPAWIAKPARKLFERARGERFRFGTAHLPVGGAYGVDEWRPEEVVRDSFELVVPMDVAAGDYLVRVRMVRQPHYPNLRLGDFFRDDDFLAGVPCGSLTVQAAARAGRVR